MIDIKKLKELAKAATDGPWAVKASTTSIFDSDVRRHIAEAMITLDTTGSGRSINTKQAIKNAEYIATVNPVTVLDLIDQLEWYQQLVDILLTASKVTKSVAFTQSDFDKDKYTEICKDVPELLKKLSINID